jgi:MFS superfamily sulfate permease-like transporter
VSVNYEDKLDCFMHLIVTAKGKPVDATQELLAIGICNIANSFVQAYPGSGALSRSAVQNASGVRTQLVGLYTGMFSTVPEYYKILVIQLC